GDVQQVEDLQDRDQHHQRGQHPGAHQTHEVTPDDHAARSSVEARLGVNLVITSAMRSESRLTGVSPGRLRLLTKVTMQIAANSDWRGIRASGDRASRTSSPSVSSRASPPRARSSFSALESGRARLKLLKLSTRALPFELVVNCCPFSSCSVTCVPLGLRTR